LAWDFILRLWLAIPSRSIQSLPKPMQTARVIAGRLTGLCLFVQWVDGRLGAFDIAEAENVKVGTKIVIHLKDDCLDYADAALLESAPF
jgi:hypothetical protein